jgi:hypothetical protein
MLKILGESYIEAIPKTKLDVYSPRNSIHHYALSPKVSLNQLDIMQQTMGPKAGGNQTIDYTREDSTTVVKPFSPSATQNFKYANEDGFDIFG